MKKKRKKYSSVKVAQKIKRELEIKEHGKQISMRPTISFRDKTKFKRNKKVKIYETDETD